MKYKIGDKVRVKEDLVAGKRYNGVYFNSSMAEQMGKVVTIEEVDEPFYYIKELDYVWVDEMFNHLFQFIKQEDKEPYNIEELLKE